MPFADRSSRISCRFHLMRPSSSWLVERIYSWHVLQTPMNCFAARSRIDVKHAMSRRILSRQQTGPGRCTVRGARIGIGEHHARLGQFINARRLVEIRSHVAGIFPAKVIEIYEQYVWLFSLQRQCRAHACGEQNDRCCYPFHSDSIVEIP